MNGPRRSGAKNLWHLTYDQFNKAEEKLRETLTTVGNGYFGTRGCFEGAADSDHHYPGTYIAGIYNRLPSTVHGKQIWNDDFVNCPNWLAVEFRIGKGRYTNPLQWTISDYHQDLDVRNAVMHRRFTAEDSQGRKTRFESSRFASMDNLHIGALQLHVTPLNYSEEISLRSAIDGTVINNGVPRYRNLSSLHLQAVEENASEEQMMLHVCTNRSHYDIVMCARTTITCEGKQPRVSLKPESREKYVSQTFSFAAVKEKTYTLEKCVSMTTSRDTNTASPVESARAILMRAGSFDDLLKPHVKVWKKLWETADISISGDGFAQQIIRLHIYHLLCTTSPNSVSVDMGMPARGLHGEAYRGHIFWDSLFVLPFFFFRFPKVARSGLMYRYRRLDAARTNAREYGYDGAMFPWQSGDSGQEESQLIHFNPVSGNWDPDLSCRQRHVSIAIFYNIWEYFYYTDDRDFLHRYGAEMLVEIARFWSSIAEFDKKDRRFHIRGVMGPDEFHEKYPGKSEEEGGLNDNAYTNVMVVWLLERSLDLLRELPTDVIHELRHSVNFDMTETRRWREIVSAMYVPITRDGIIEQFEGYMKLRELDWEQYRSKYGNIHRMDRILKSEGDSPDKYKVAKQADALMLFYVLSPEEVFGILSRLRYKIKDKKNFLRKMYDFYEQRTSHGSTLSKIVHAAISRKMHSREDMWRWYMEALESDVHDSQGGTTVEGIHCGVMAGTIDIINRVFAGISFSNDGIDINPSLPSHWKRLSFKLLLRGTWYAFDISQNDVTVCANAKTDRQFFVRMRGEDAER